MGNARIVPAGSPHVRRKWLTRASGREAIRPLLGDRHYSLSVLRAAMLFAALPVNGAPRGLRELADMAGISPGSARRYVETLCVIGLAAPVGKGTFRRTCALSRRSGERSR